MNTLSIAKKVLNMAGLSGHIEQVSNVSLDDLADPDFVSVVALYKIGGEELVYDIVEIHGRGVYNGDPNDVTQFYESGYGYYNDGSVERVEDLDDGEISLRECTPYCGGADYYYIVFE